MRLHESSSSGVGVIQGIENNPNVEGCLIARVLIGEDSVSIRIDELVKESQVKLYESLHAGDLVLYGREKQAVGLVLNSRIKQRRKDGIAVTTKIVTVLENGLKKRLSLRHEILDVRRGNSFV